MPPNAPDRPAARAAGVAGLLAGGPALLALLLGSVLFGAPGLLEAIADGVLRLVPTDVFDTVLGALGPLAKGLLFAGVCCGAVLAGGLLAAGLARLGAFDRLPERGPAIAAASRTGLAAITLVEIALLPLAGLGLLGAGAVAPLALHVPIVVAAAAYALGLVGIVGREARRRITAGDEVGAPIDPVAAGIPPALPRRTILGGALGLAGLAALGTSGLVVVGRIAGVVGSSSPSPRGTAAPGGFGPTPATTPLGDFYTVSKDLVPPAVDGAAWRLTVAGLVEQPRTYALDEIRALPQVRGFRTLACISNEVATPDRLIGNQAWVGTPAREVLAAAGPLPAARYVLWRSADGYAESLPLEVALDDETWLAWGMDEDGAALAAEHGFPLRVLVAGRFGMKQPKWLTEIRLSADDQPGFWEELGWDETASGRTMSRIDEPRPGDRVPAGEPLPVYGIAWAGDRGIARVEVSPDGGTSWLPAELEPVTSAGPIGPLTWVRWRVTLPAPRVGAFQLVSRATDGLGALQEEVLRSPLPSGATGWCRVQIEAA